MLTRPIYSTIFGSVFSIDNGQLPPFPNRLPDANHCIGDITINPDLVFKALIKLKPNLAAGPDELPPIFYYNTATTLSYPLALLFRSFIDLKDMPNDWRLSIVTPKFKQGSASNVENYRPIALTCTASKILETLIAEQLLQFLSEHKLISKHQHGFLKKHSTSTNLLETFNDWTLSLNNRHSVLSGYIDFKRAFDVISHPKLVHKLSSYGVRGNLLAWIEAFLSNRKQCVRVGHSKSSIISVTSGVPQGSCIGPLLFCVFINDVTDLFDPTIHIKLFADDIKIYTELNLPTSDLQFQHQLDLIHSWATLWQLQISYPKCNVICIGARPCIAPFKIGDSQISAATAVKDLGVTIDSKFSFIAHIRGMTARARQRSALIFRCFLSRDCANLIRAFRVYIRPLLEYSSTVWSPSTKYLIDDIEGVQRSFTKRLPGYGELSYEQRLRRSKLQSLEHRRLISDLITCYNIVHGHSSLKFSDFFKFSNSQITRGHELRLDVPLAHSSIRHNFFSCRVVKPWNSLPATIVKCGSTKSFKRLLSNTDLSIFLKFPCITKLQ